MQKRIYNTIKQCKVYLFIIGISSLAFLYSVKDFILLKKLFTHDSIYWFGVFHYFQDSIYNHTIPLWNPYIHGGEPFWYMINMFHLYDPFKLMLIGLGSLWNVNLVWLYQFSILFQLTFTAFGIYAYYREILGSKGKYTFYLLPLVLMSAFTRNSLSSIGNIDIFWHFPFILLFTTRYLKNKRFIDILLSSFFIGVSFQQYHCVLILFTLIVYISCFSYFQRQQLLQSIEGKSILKHLIIAFFLVFILASPFLALYFEKDEIIPFGRILEKIGTSSTLMGDYESLICGGASHGNYIDLLAIPFYSIAKLKYLGSSLQKPYMGCYLSETQMYIGLIPSFLFLLGLFCGSNKYKRLFFIMLFISFNMFLGPQSFVHFVAYKLLPFLRLNSHSQQFGTFTLFFMFFFVLLGIQYLFHSKVNFKNNVHEMLNDVKFIYYILIVWICSQCLYHSIYYNKVFYNYCEKFPEFNFGLAFTPLIFFQVSIFIISLATIYICLFKKKLIMPIIRSMTVLNNFSTKRPKVIFLIILILSLFEWIFYDRLIHTEGHSVFTTRSINKLNFNMHAKPFDFENYRYKATFDQNSGTDFATFYDLEEKMNINFQASIVKKVTASDWFINTPYVPDFVGKRVIHLFYYLKDYYNIIYGNISEDVKDKLLGAGKEIISFYPYYTLLTENEFNNYLNKKAFNCDLENPLIIIENNARGTIKDAPVELGMQTEFLFNIKRYSPHKLEMDISANQEGFLVFRDAYHKDWRAYIDKKNVNIFKANGIYKSVYITKGEHTVIFKYCPSVYLCSLLLYFSGVIIVIVYSVVKFIPWTR